MTSSVKQFSDQSSVKRKADPVLIGLWISLFVVAFLWALPTIFVVFTSLKSSNEIYTRPAYAPPAELAWENYSDAWDQADLPTVMLNSLIISFFKVPLGIFLAALIAYVLTRCVFGIKKCCFC
jgi:raffinose/stachyose/melibiose transport system permease protein